MKLSINPLLPIGNYMNKRYGIEMEFPDDSNISDNFKFLNEAITAVHMMEYPMFYKDGKPLYIPQDHAYQGEEPSTQIKEPPTKLTKEEKQKKYITDTTTIEGADGLKSFALLVSKNPHLQETYDNQMELLQSLKK